MSKPEQPHPRPEGVTALVWRVPGLQEAVFRIHKIYPGLPADSIERVLGLPAGSILSRMKSLESPQSLL